MAESYEYADNYFWEQSASIAEFWARFGSEPSWDGLRVLDLGCGHGAMSVQLAQAGAVVTGVDVDVDRIGYARKNAAARFPELAETLTFESVEVESLLVTQSFDVVVSKDTFEHISDPDLLLRALCRVLKPGGHLYVGFSPLYYSPYGDHGRTGMRVPWAHAVVPLRIVLARASRFHHVRIAELIDLGLNGWTGRQFLDAFEASDFEVSSAKINQGSQRLLKALNQIRRYPLLERFATVSIYAVLRRPA